MKLLIGSDKSGFILKETIKAYLEENGISYEDIGTQNPDEPMPFFKVAPIAGEKLVSGQADKAILICGTGMGMAQVSGKYKGIRAACVESLYAAKMCRAVNDANILCMGGWIIGPEMGLDMAKTFLNTAFTEGLEDWRAKALKGAKEEFAKIEDNIY